MAKVIFFQAAHRADDDRVCYHQQKSLMAAGFAVDFIPAADYARLEAFAEMDEHLIVVCDTPVAIWKARRLKRAVIVYDVTEWYPSKKNLRSVTWYRRPIKAIVLAAANLWAGAASDAFLFGEYHKTFPLRYLFPWKRQMMLSYYPSKQYIFPLYPYATSDLSRQIRLFYAGPRTKEKGYFRVLELARTMAERNPQLQVRLTVVTDLSEDIADEMKLETQVKKVLGEEMKNLSVILKDRLPFEDFCREICRHDIMLDLRSDDVENTRCLPIKLFYYLAAARPVIYSSLRAIRRAVPELTESLFSPDDIGGMADAIEKLIRYPQYFNYLCERNRHLYVDYFNWEKQEKQFVQFMRRLSGAGNAQS